MSDLRPFTPRAGSVILAIAPKGVEDMRRVAVAVTGPSAVEITVAPGLETAARIGYDILERLGKTPEDAWASSSVNHSLDLAFAWLTAEGTGDLVLLGAERLRASVAADVVSEARGRGITTWLVAHELPRPLVGLLDQIVTLDRLVAHLATRGAAVGCDTGFDLLPDWRRAVGAAGMLDRDIARHLLERLHAGRHSNLSAADVEGVAATVLSGRDPSSVATALAGVLGPRWWRIDVDARRPAGGSAQPARSWAALRPIREPRVAASLVALWAARDLGRAAGIRLADVAADASGIAIGSGRLAVPAGARPYLLAHLASLPRDNVPDASFLGPRGEPISPRALRTIVAAGLERVGGTRDVAEIRYHGSDDWRSLDAAGIRVTHPTRAERAGRGSDHDHLRHLLAIRADRCSCPPAAAAKPFEGMTGTNTFRTAHTNRMRAW